MKPLAQNTLLQNRYLVVQLIGKGGMGEVYLAVDQRLGSAVALKRTFFSDDEMLGNAFEREARTLARLRHPALPKVSDHFTEQDKQYLVMEHISGEDLYRRLSASQKPFPLSWVLFWADQLLDALNYLHSNEPPIIHRDIKPQNLKLTDENHIVLLDFGLAKNTIGQTRVTSSGSVAGYTPHYAPMEQIRGTGTNPRSDIYSLSATLYQLLTNIVPPDALSRADSLLNDQPDPLRPISDINAEVSRGLSDVILKGMEISQDKRFSNAKEMQKALRDAYSNMQNAMSAQTVAFNTRDEVVGVEVPQSQKQTEVIESPVVSNPTPSTPVVSNPNPVQSAIETEVIPSSLNTGAGQKTNNSYPTQPAEEEVPDFEATLQYDSDSLGIPFTRKKTQTEEQKPPAEEQKDQQEKQSDLKTEVLLAGSSPEIAAYQQPEAPVAEEDSENTNDFGGNNYGETNYNESGNNYDENKNYSPDVTVPLLAFGKQDYPVESKEPAEEPEVSNLSALNFFTSPEVNANAGATYIPNQDYSSDDEDFSPETYQQESYQEEKEFVTNPEIDSEPPVIQPKPVKKKSTGKLLAIAAGVGFILFLFLGAAAGVGLYVSGNLDSLLGGTTTPTPSILPTPTISPTPEPTQEAIIIDNTNPDNTNADNTNPDNTKPDNTNPDDTPRPEKTLDGSKTPRPVPTRSTTPRPTPTSRPTRTPRPVPTYTRTPAPTKTPIVKPTLKP